MRFSAVLGLICLLATAVPALAQISVSAQMADDRSDFLLYERSDILVTVTNTSETDIVLDNDGQQPWLSFVICKHDRIPVRPERKAFFKPLTLKQGESQTLRVNLTPLFSFREAGSYTAQAAINLPGAGYLVSQEVPFTVQHGRKIWSQQRPVAGSDRIYSLIRFSPKPDATELYLRVEDPSENVVYANVGLGQIEAYVDPQVFFDPQGNIHVLHLISMSTYLYSRADPQGKVQHQGVFKTFQEIPPRLRQMEDGSVYVAGGLELTPQSAHESLLAGQRDSTAPSVAPAAKAAGIGSVPAGANDVLTTSNPNETPKTPPAPPTVPPSLAPAPSLGAPPDSH